LTRKLMVSLAFRAPLIEKSTKNGEGSIQAPAYADSTIHARSKSTPRSLHGVQQSEVCTKRMFEILEHFAARCMASNSLHTGRHLNDCFCILQVLRMYKQAGPEQIEAGALWH
jgi:hypothetical protein